MTVGIHVIEQVRLGYIWK